VPRPRRRFATSVGGKKKKKGRKCGIGERCGWERQRKKKYARGLLFQKTRRREKKRKEGGGEGTLSPACSAICPACAIKKGGKRFLALAAVKGRGEKNWWRLQPDILTLRPAPLPKKRGRKSGNESEIRRTRRLFLLDRHRGRLGGEKRGKGRGGKKELAIL